MSRSVLSGVAELAAWGMRAPVACISLVAADRRLWSDSYGLSTPCALLVSWPVMRELVTTGRPLVVPDARRHPAAARTAGVRDGTVAAYAGMPLIASNGRVMGALAVMDRQPRQWSRSQLDSLRWLSARTVHEVERGQAVHGQPRPGLRRRLHDHQSA